MCVHCKHIFHPTACASNHKSILYVAAVGNSPVMKQRCGSATCPGLADITLMYRAVCSPHRDSIMEPNSGACSGRDGGVRVLSYGPSGVAHKHSVYLILVSRLQEETHFSLP